jgi:MFS family permease
MESNSLDCFCLFLLPWNVSINSCKISWNSRSNRKRYNALSGIGAGGQVNAAVASNASTALFSTTAVFALFICGPLLSILGPQVMLLIGGWTYALYSGSLLNFNKSPNGGFVIASGALLGIGSSFLWVAQGTIMTSYVKENLKDEQLQHFGLFSMSEVLSVL